MASCCGAGFRSSQAVWAVASEGLALISCFDILSGNVRPCGDADVFIRRRTMQPLQLETCPAAGGTPL